jgi:hypothetical protein
MTRLNHAENYKKEPLLNISFKNNMMKNNNGRRGPAEQAHIFLCNAKKIS